MEVILIKIIIYKILRIKEKLERGRHVSDPLVYIPYQHPRHIHKITILEFYVLGHISLSEHGLHIGHHNQRPGFPCAVSPNDKGVLLFCQRCNTPGKRDGPDDITGVFKGINPLVIYLAHYQDPFTERRQFRNIYNITIIKYDIAAFIAFFKDIIEINRIFLPLSDKGDIFYISVHRISSGLCYKVHQCGFALKEDPAATSRTAGGGNPKRGDLA